MGEKRGDNNYYSRFSGNVFMKKCEEASIWRENTFLRWENSRHNCEIILTLSERHNENLINKKLEQN